MGIQNGEKLFRNQCLFPLCNSISLHSLRTMTDPHNVGYQLFEWRRFSLYSIQHFVLQLKSGSQQARLTSFHAPNLTLIPTTRYFLFLLFQHLLSEEDYPVPLSDASCCHGDLSLWWWITKKDVDLVVSAWSHISQTWCEYTVRVAHLNWSCSSTWVKGRCVQGHLANHTQDLCFALTAILLHASHRMDSERVQHLEED